MKIGEKLLFDHETDSVIHKKTYDHTHELQRAKMLRDTLGDQQGADKKLVGTIPMDLITEWLKEAGVSWDDHDARAEVIKRKMLSGEFDKFRVWKGRY